MGKRWVVAVSVNRTSVSPVRQGLYLLSHGRAHLGAFQQAQKSPACPKEGYIIMVFLLTVFLPAHVSLQHVLFWHWL